MNIIYNKGGVNYYPPEVFLLNHTGLGVAEFSARTCYDSFENSENKVIKDLNDEINNNTLESHNLYPELLDGVIQSELLDRVAWRHQHHSILEHINLSYLIKGTSRGVLQEHARHRIQALSVRSTRYTMSDILYAFYLSVYFHNYAFFEGLMLSFDMFVIADTEYNKIEIKTIHDKLIYQYKTGIDFEKLIFAKDNLEFVKSTPDVSIHSFYETLKSNPKKSNVGDNFKHIVTDNWKVDLVTTFNLRSLKNYFDLRDNGGAYFQIRELAVAMKNVTPKKYLRLIDKEYKKEIT